jgi:hypothetical protein
VDRGGEGDTSSALLVSDQVEPSCRRVDEVRVRQTSPLKLNQFHSQSEGKTAMRADISVQNKNKNIKLLMFLFFTFNLYILYFYIYYDQVYQYVCSCNITPPIH